MIQILEQGSRRLRHLLGIDRAVGFTVLARSWTILSGAFTVLLIAHFLTPVEQGYYYTFSSLVSMQVVFELGFSFVVLQLAAHECSRLSIRQDGVIQGDEAARSRLASILQKAVRWYSVAAAIMAAVLVAAGFYFFSVHQRASGSAAWKLPWLCVVLAAIFTFQMDPVFSFLEGCGFVSQVARLRLAQAMTGTALAWLALTLHKGLFAPAGIISGQAIAGFAFLASKRRLLLPLLRYRPGKNIVGWRAEIWPFQWRMAVSYFCSYFILPLFNPVLFAYRGAAEAGRMGMSTTIATAVATVAYSWVYTKVSPFGNMVALREYDRLDHVFFKAVRQSMAFLLAADATVLGLLYLAHYSFPHLAARVLPVPLFSLILLTTILLHLLYCEAVYLRAHKREPFLVLSALVALFTAVTTLVAGRLWGAAGITAGYFVWGGVFQLIFGTWIFFKKRREWHSESTGALVTGPRPV